MTFDRSKHGAPIIGIVGWKNSGKTTLAVRLIAEFTRRGLRVASVKHAHHSFNIDDKETDSARHRRAGAGQVAIVSSQRWALVSETPAGEPDFVDVIDMLAPSDLIIVEGYKSARLAKIEARRGNAADAQPLAPNDPGIIAVATDLPATNGGGLPVFALDDIAALADFIAARLAIAKIAGEKRT